MPDNNTSQVGSAQVGDLWIGASGGGQAISGTAGGQILISGGTGGELLQGQVLGAINGGWAGGEILISGGAGGALIQASARNVTVFIAGQDRTSWVGIPIRRSMQVGSAGGTLTFSINNHKKTDYRPSKFDEVLVYVGTYRFFCGIVDTYDETFYSGTSGYYELAVRCLSYGAMLNFVYVGRHYEVYNGTLLGIIMFDLVNKYLSPFGITWGGQGSGWYQTDPIPPITFNWDTFEQVCKGFDEMFSLDHYVDQWKVLRMFSYLNGLNPAPFQIATNNGLWRGMTVTRGGAYANEVGVRNSQDLGSVWTDEYTATAAQPTFIVSAELKAKPRVLVNDVAESVTDAGVYTQPWLWYWLPFSVVRNPLNPLAGGENIKIKYPSSLSYVTWVRDDAEIVAHGKFQYLIESKDVLSRDQQVLLAQGELARRKADVTSIAVETDEIGLEPGQVLTVDTLRPLVSDDFLIESVDSEEYGLGGESARASKTAQVKGFFRHTVRASNAQLVRRGSGAALFGKLFDQARQPKDRVETPIGFTLAETVPGITNPGLTVGVPTGAVRRAPKSGVARQCSIYFRSSETVLTTVDCIVDIYQNGTSIFPAGDAAKMVWPAAVTAAQVNFIFVTDPLDVTEGDIFTIEVLQADAAAKDGVIELSVLG